MGRRLFGHTDAGEEAPKEESAYGFADPSASVEVGGCPGRIKTRKLGASLWRLQVSGSCGFDIVNHVFDLE